jgi:hypothetical protein
MTLPTQTMYCRSMAIEARLEIWRVATRPHCHWMTNNSWLAARPFVYLKRVGSNGFYWLPLCKAVVRRFGGDVSALSGEVCSDRKCRIFGMCLWSRTLTQHLPGTPGACYMHQLKNNSCLAHPGPVTCISWKITQLSFEFYMIYYSLKISYKDWLNLKKN